MAYKPRLSEHELEEEKKHESSLIKSRELSEDVPGGTQKHPYVLCHGTEFSFLPWAEELTLYEPALPKVVKYMLHKVSSVVFSC